MRDIEFRGKTKVIAGNSFNSGKDDGTCPLCTFSKERVVVVGNIYDFNEDGRL